MAFLFVLVAFFIVVGPILWLQPTREDKRLVALREHARKSGFRMEFVRLDTHKSWAPWLLRNPHLPPTGWMRYYIELPDPRRDDLPEMSWKQRRQPSGQLVWEETPVGVTPPPALAGLIADWARLQDARFLALESAPRRVSVIWNEVGNAAVVDTLADVLKRYADAG